MAEPTTPPDPTQVDPPAPDDNAPSDAARQTLKDLVKESIHEYFEEHKPEPTRTRQPARNIFADVWNFGAK